MPELNIEVSSDDKDVILDIPAAGAWLLTPKEALNLAKRIMENLKHLEARKGK